MTVVHVPRPKKTSMDPNRPVSLLLTAQIEHLHQAERRLPPQYQSGLYVNAIKTEGEAAEYIRKVTNAIHKAHEDAARKRGTRGGPKPVIQGSSPGRGTTKRRTRATKAVRRKK